MDEVAEIPNYLESERFTDLEKDALAMADGLTETPAHVSDELFERLRAALGDKQVVELAAAIATENFSARFNHAFDIDSNQLAE